MSDAQGNAHLWIHQIAGQLRSFFNWNMAIFPWENTVLNKWWICPVVCEVWANSVTAQISTFFQHTKSFCYSTVRKHGAPWPFVGQPYGRSHDNHYLFYKTCHDAPYITELTKYYVSRITIRSGNLTLLWHARCSGTGKIVLTLRLTNCFDSGTGKIVLTLGLKNCFDSGTEFFSTLGLEKLIGLWDCKEDPTKAVTNLLWAVTCCCSCATARPEPISYSRD